MVHPITYDAWKFCARLYTLSHHIYFMIIRVKYNLVTMYWKVVFSWFINWRLPIQLQSLGSSKTLSNKFHTRSEWESESSVCFASSLAVIICSIVNTEDMSTIITTFLGCGDTVPTNTSLQKHRYSGYTKSWGKKVRLRVQLKWYNWSYSQSHWHY